MDKLTAKIAGQERPSTADLVKDLGRFCRAHGHRAPSRATIYNFIATTPVHHYRFGPLPRAVRDALYNLGPDGSVPGHQVVFYCMNYGDMNAVMFAAGMPWIDLYQADRMRGWRPKSHGLLRAAIRCRGI